MRRTSLALGLALVNSLALREAANAVPVKVVAFDEVEPEYAEPSDFAAIGPRIVTPNTYAKKLPKEARSRAGSAKRPDKDKEKARAKMAKKSRRINRSK